MAHFYNGLFFLKRIMKKIIDLHTHLNTLDEFFQLRTKFQSHPNTTVSHIKHDYKVILSVAMYVQIYQDYNSLIKLIKNYKTEISSLEKVQLILSPEDLDKDFKVGIILHVESGRVLNDANSQLEELYALGVRGIIPIHFKDNMIGTSCDHPLRRVGFDLKDKGLSTYGREFVEKCNQLKIWLDLTHTTDKTADEILELANYCMVSHIGIRDTINRKRNKSIDFYTKLSKKGGLIGITPWCHLIGDTQDSLYNTFKYGLDHGLEKSLCIGTDFGAPIKTHETIKSIFDIGNIVDELPHSIDDIRWNNAYKFLIKAL
jgi:microsomal dipeptidase-like Zn-dependent dipeptidase